MNPFEVLGIPPNSTEQEIKLAFRNLALKYHPDKNDGNSEQFLKIKTAYEQAIKLRTGLNIFDISDSITISVKESLGNLNRSYQLQREVPCDCGAFGVKCIKCHGSKYIKVGFNTKVKCTRCNGSGFENPNNCNKCKGSGYKPIVESIKLTSNNIINNGEIRYYNYSVGRLVLTFKIQKSDSDIYDRVDNDLIYLAKISPIDQIIGTTLFIPRINQDSLRLQIKENVAIPSYYKVDNSGVPGTNGNLIIKLVVDSELMDLSLIPIIREAVRRK